MRMNIIGNPVPVCNEETVRNNYKALTEYLIEKKLTISTMESCTGGQIASLITDTEGSSAIIKGAFVTYSNEAKVMQGVPLKLVDEYSVYSNEVAQAMATVCRDKYGSDIGIGVTGTMGNFDPANKNVSIPGLVYISISYKDSNYNFEKKIPPQPSRYLYKLYVADIICLELKKLLNA